MNTLNTQVRSSFAARLTASLRKLAKDRRGATTVEYLVLLAFVGLGVIAGATAIRDAVNAKGTGLGGDIAAIPGGAGAAPAGN